MKPLVGNLITAKASGLNPEIVPGVRRRDH
jgi:hypothetical protein